MSTSAMSTLQKSTVTPYKVLIVGGCYAGLAAVTNLLDLCEGRPPRFAQTSEFLMQRVPVEFTIVDERDGYYHLIGSPLALASPTYAEKAWVKFSEIPGLQHPAIKFVQGSVTNVDMQFRTATVKQHGRETKLLEKYDYLVAASGLRRVWPVVPQSLTKEEYISEAQEHIDQVRSGRHGVVVIGGGAVGIEMAAELKLMEPSLKVTLIHSRSHLLSSEPLPDEFKEETLRVVQNAGVTTIMGKRVSHVSERNDDDEVTLTLSDNSMIVASRVINAISRSTLTTDYLPSSVLDEEGYVKVKPSLHLCNGFDTERDDYHYAAGDIALWTGIKRCGAAMHMGGICAHNIHQHMASRVAESRPSSPYASRASDSFNDIPVLVENRIDYKEMAEFPPMIGIAIGDSGAVYSPTEGIKTGPEVLAYMFGDDLGFNMCYRHLKLHEAPPSLSVECKVGPTDLETVRVIDEIKQTSRQPTPTLSTTSAESPEVEPQTPVDAVGNAEVTNFEVLERTISGSNQADLDELVATIKSHSVTKSNELEDITEAEDRVAV